MKRCAILTDFKDTNLICYKSEVRFLPEDTFNLYVTYGWVKELNEVDLPEDVIVPGEIVLEPNQLQQTTEIPSNG